MCLLLMASRRKSTSFRHEMGAFASARAYRPRLQYVEYRRGSGDGAVVVALVVDEHARADAAVGPAVRGPVDAERSDLAAGHEHHVPALHLQLPGARLPGRQVDRGGLQKDMLRPDVQRGVGRG